MKILIVRTWPEYLDVKKRTYNIQELGLSKALVRKGHVCDILFWTDKNEETVEIPVEARTPVEHRGTIKVFYRRGKTLLKNTVYTGCNELFDQYDILQAAEYNQMQTWLLVKNRPEKTIIYHGPYYSPFNRRFNLICKPFDLFFKNLYIRKGTAFITKSELAKKFLSEKGIPQGKIQTIGVGIDAEMLAEAGAECTEPLYTRMKSDQSEIKLLYIGRMERRRNIPFILDVFQKVLEKQDAMLYMVGTGDKKYCENVKSLIEKLGIADRVVWQEKMEQKYLSGIYQMADFFLLTTEYEIFGMVLLEAMYYQAVVLTTQNGGSSTLIQNGANGFIIEKKDAREWASAILSIWNDKDRMAKIQEDASQKIADEYTWDCLAEKFIEQYTMKVKGR